MVDYLVRFLASLRSRRDCSRGGSGRPQRPTSEAEGASVLQVAGRCRPRRFRAIAPSVLAGKRARAPRGRASAATTSAQDIYIRVNSMCVGRIQAVVLFMALSFCLLRFVEGGQCILFLEVFAQSGGPHERGRSARARLLQHYRCALRASP